MTRGRPPYSVLEHTADAAVLVRACAVEALFERCAAAMFDLVADIEAVAAALDTDSGARLDTVSVTAADREELLVAFLGELLSRSSAEGRVYGAFAVDTIGATGEAGTTTLNARAWSVPLDLAAHRFRSELKAVTYHELLVSEDSDGWSARVIFDV